MTRSLSLTLATLVMVVLTLVTGCSTSQDPGKAITRAAPSVRPDEARERIEAGAVVVDVRTPEEFETGHVAGALNLDLQGVEFLDELDDLDRDDSFVVYCRTGSRATTATDHMADLGFDDVVNAGGFDELDAAGVQVE